jgi:hypothetical protein
MAPAASPIAAIREDSFSLASPIFSEVHEVED